MGETESVSPPQQQRPRVTITLPPRSGMEALFTGSGFGLSPGPLTLVSSYFSHPDSDSPSFSQLLAGAINSPLPPSTPPQLVFPSLGPFEMSHQQALAQVTAQAQANLHTQAGFQSSLEVPSAPAPFPGCTSDSSVQQNTTSSPPESKDTKEPQYSGSDKPVDDAFNWRKYGQKQVKGSEFPRSYYKCTHPSCPVKKKVERFPDGQVKEIIYKGQHNHDPPRKRSKDGSNSNKDLGTQGNRESRQPQAGITNSESTSHSTKRDQESILAAEEHLSSDEEEVGNNETRESRQCEDEPDAKRRSTEVRVMEQTGAASHRAVTEPRIIVQTTSEVDLLDDGYRWRKYGQKVVKGNPYPRSYYKCTFSGCNVRKHVERAATDPKAVVTTYEGKHNHDIPAGRTSSHNTANNSAAQTRPYSSAGSSNANVGNTNFSNNNQQLVVLLRLKEEGLA